MAEEGESSISGVTLTRGLLSCLLILTGCSDVTTGPDNLNEYLDRLSSVTGLTPEPAISYPELRLDLPREPIGDSPTSKQIDLIEFLSLSGCELQVNLGRRNTQLGKAAPPSQRLLMDLEFIALAPTCISLLREREENQLADKLQQVRLERQELLPLSISQATLMGSEWRLFWERPTALENYPLDTSSLIAQSLSRLADLTNGWLNGDWTGGNTELELLLSHLRSGDGGALIFAHSLASRDLERATDLLGRTRALAPFCPYGRHTTRSRALEQVVKQWFISKVQPWLVSLRRRAELLLQPIKSLETPLSEVVSPRYHRWIAERDQLLAEQAVVIRAHVESIQTTLEPCRNS